MATTIGVEEHKLLVIKIGKILFETFKEDSLQNELLNMTKEDFKGFVSDIHYKVAPEIIKKYFQKQMDFLQEILSNHCSSQIGSQVVSRFKSKEREIVNTMKMIWVSRFRSSEKSVVGAGSYDILSNIAIPVISFDYLGFYNNLQMISKNNNQVDTDINPEGLFDYNQLKLGQLYYLFDLRAHCLHPLPESVKYARLKIKENNRLLLSPPEDIMSLSLDKKIVNMDRCLAASGYSYCDAKDRHNFTTPVFIEEQLGFNENKISFLAQPKKQPKDFGILSCAKRELI